MTKSRDDRKNKLAEEKKKATRAKQFQAMQEYLDKATDSIEGQELLEFIRKDDNLIKLLSVVDFRVQQAMNILPDLVKTVESLSQGYLSLNQRLIALEPKKKSSRIIMPPGSMKH